MILANGCNITKSETFKGVWIISVPTVCPSNEVNFKHEEVNLKMTHNCDLKYTTTSAYLIMYVESILSMDCYNDNFQYTV